MLSIVGEHEQTCTECKGRSIDANCAVVQNNCAALSDVEHINITYITIIFDRQTKHESLVSFGSAGLHRVERRPIGIPMLLRTTAGPKQSLLGSHWQAADHEISTNQSTDKGRLEEVFLLNVSKAVNYTGVNFS